MTREEKNITPATVIETANAVNGKYLCLFCPDSGNDVVFPRAGEHIKIAILSEGDKN